MQHRTDHSPLRYAFCIECSMRSGVPNDHGPADLQICSSHVPVRPISANSPGLNSGGGSKKGMAREWFLIRNRWFQRCTKCRARSRAGWPTTCMETSCLKGRGLVSVRVWVRASLSADVPWHPRDLRPVVHVFVRLVERVEVEHAGIAVVLARPDVLRAIGSRVRIVDEDVLRSIPSDLHLSTGETVAIPSEYVPAKAMIQSTHECNGLIDDTEFLMLDLMSISREDVTRSTTHMRPVEGTSLEVRR